MLKKFKHIVLIDNDETINYYHNYIIEKCHLAEEVLIVQDINEAYELLKGLASSNQICSSLIFLDVKILKRNGFELIEKNKGLMGKLVNLGYKLLVLTSSSKLQDIEQCKGISLISEYIQKPITENTLKRLQDTYL